MKIENEKYLIMLKIIALLCGQVICGYSMLMQKADIRRYINDKKIKNINKHI